MAGDPSVHVLGTEAEQAAQANARQLATGSPPTHRVWPNGEDGGDVPVGEQRSEPDRAASDDRHGFGSPSATHHAGTLR